MGSPISPPDTPELTAHTGDGLTPVSADVRAFDNALVASVNLRLADLPRVDAGEPGQTPLLHLPVANSTVECPGHTGASPCLGVPVPTTAGLFAGADAPGPDGRRPLARHSVDGIHPGIQMRSMTTAVGRPAQAQVPRCPVRESRNFAGCYGQFARTVAAAAIPGAVDPVQLVTLSPAGRGQVLRVHHHGDLVAGTQVFGQAYMVGGRLVTDLHAGHQRPEHPVVRLRTPPTRGVQPDVHEHREVAARPPRARRADPVGGCRQVLSGT